jgi:hypothetical protein
MAEFDVKIIERLEKTVTVEAGSSEDAEAKALKNWLEVEEGYVLDSSDFTDVEFEAVPAGFYEICE